MGVCRMVVKACDHFLVKRDNVEERFWFQAKTGRQRIGLDLQTKTNTRITTNNVLMYFCRSDDFHARKQNTLQLDRHNKQRDKLEDFKIEILPISCSWLMGVKYEALS